MKKHLAKILSMLLGIAFLFGGCSAAQIGNTAVSIASELLSEAAATTNIVPSDSDQSTSGVTVPSGTLLNPDDIPAFSGKPYIEINNNQPDFTQSDLTTKSYEYYSPLDRLGRCGECVACVGVDLMPTEKRGNISSVKPTGWQKYSFDFVSGGSLYNRCHLIAHQLAGEDANKQNLITGTRYLNETGMLPFEEKVGDYVRSSKKHVLYRVTPVFKGDELVARGVQMEGYSVEDKGKSICYNVYCYNVQPGVTINYATGEAAADGSATTTETTKKSTGSKAEIADDDITYILNTKGKKFHLPDCDAVKTMSEKNKAASDKSREELIKEGYEPCGSCRP